MFLNFRTFAETVLDAAITIDQTEITLFNPDVMPEVPFLLYLSEGLSLNELQVSERVLVYKRVGDVFTIARDWDNMYKVSGVDESIAGSEGDTAFTLSFSDWSYFRIDNGPFLYRYVAGTIEPPLQENVNGMARLVGQHWPLDRASAHAELDLALILLGDINLEEIQDANREYVLPEHMEVTTLTASSHVKVGPSTLEEDGVIRYQDNDLWAYKNGAWASLTQQGGSGSWTPPTGTIGGIVYYTAEDTLTPTTRISIGSRISLDSKFSVDDTDLQFDTLSIDGGSIVSGNAAGVGIFDSSYGETYAGTLQVTGDIQTGEIIVNGYSLYVETVTETTSGQYDITLSAPLDDPITASDTYTTANDLRSPLTIAGSDILLTGDTITLNTYDHVDIYSAIINLNDKLKVNGDIEAVAPIKFIDHSQWVSRADYPSAPANGMVIFHDDDGLQGYSAGAWHPLLVEDIETPFPVPADQYATISYDGGWNSTSELLLDPDGAKFAHSIIVGEKRSAAPLVAGMIEYVNNDIQGIIRQGSAFVRVSLTNLIEGQRLPQADDGVIPFAENDLWVSDSNFTYAGGVLKTPLIKVGSEVDMAGTIRYNGSSLQWHNGSTWQEFAGGSASVADPTDVGSMLVSDGAEWLETIGLSYSDGELQVDALKVRGIEVINISDEITADIRPDGSIIANSLTIAGVAISSLGISGVTTMQVTDMIVANELTVHKLKVDEMPDNWSFTTLALGDYSFNVDDTSLQMDRGTTPIARYTSSGVAFTTPVTLQDLTIDGDVTFNYTIVVGDEQNPGLTDIPGMIRFNGDFQGHLGGGRWASFTLSLADGESGLVGAPSAEFGTGLYWNGDQWFKSAFRVGDDGAIQIGDTDDALAGVLRWTGTNFQGCIAPAVWVNLSGSTGGASLPEALVLNSTLRWNGTDWIENTQLRSDGIKTTASLLQIEPYENFYDLGAVRTAGSIGDAIVEIKSFSTVPYGTVKFANHETIYTVTYATSEEMTLDPVLSTAVGENIAIYIQGVLPRPATESGQVRFNQNDYEGFVENIGWVSFTGHLSHLPTKVGDTSLVAGNPLYFDGSMWRAYHDIRFRPDVIEINKETEIYGDLHLHGSGYFDGVKVNEAAPAVEGMIRYKDARFQGCMADGTWVHLSSPILEVEPLDNGQTLVYRNGWWYNSDLLVLSDTSAVLKPKHLMLDVWDIRSLEVTSGEPEEVIPTLTFGNGEQEEIFEIRGLGSEGVITPEVIARAKVRANSLLLHDDPEYIPSLKLEVFGSGKVTGALTLGSLNAGATSLGNTTINDLHVLDDITVDSGDLSLLSGSIESYRINVEDQGWFGSTVRVGYRKGVAEVGAIRYSSLNNAARGDWEGWDGEQWVSFTAGFHGQAIWGNPALGDIVAFDGDRWRPSQGMNVIDDEVHLGKTFLQVDTTAAAVGDEGRIRFTGTHVEACIAETWVPLNSDLNELPEGATFGQTLYWQGGVWLPTERLLVTTEKTRLNNVLELEDYDDLVGPAAPAPGQIRYNQNDYEAYKAGIGWISLTGHVPFQKPWEHSGELLWSDGSNWVGCPYIAVTETEVTLADDLDVVGEIKAAERITSEKGIGIGLEDAPDENTLHHDTNNRLKYDGKALMAGEANVDASIPRGVVYYETEQFKNSSAVRMMTRSIS